MRFRQHQDDAQRATRRLLWLFILTVTLTVLAVNAALALAWAIGSGMLFGFPRWFFETNTAVALAFILGGGAMETMRLREGGARVATMVGGRELLHPANPREQRFRNVVDEMAGLMIRTWSRVVCPPTTEKRPSASVVVRSGFPHPPQNA